MIYQSASASWEGAEFIGKVEMILRDFLFSRLSFSLVIELPFLKFIRYIFTVWSSNEKAVKKLWSAHVMEIL